MSTSLSSAAGGSSSGGENFSEQDETTSNKLGFFNGNFTRNEVQLSQMVIHFWTNFIRGG